MARMILMDGTVVSDRDLQDPYKRLKFEAKTINQFSDVIDEVVKTRKNSLKLKKKLKSEGLHLADEVIPVSRFYIFKQKLFLYQRRICLLKNKLKFSFSSCFFK